MLKNSHTLVICSRGRSNSLSNVITSILDCRESKNVHILIVLNGHSPSELNNLIKQYKDLEDQILVIESKPGLAAARNVALANISGDIVTFLDDDVLLPDNYLTEVDSAFSFDEKLDGLSPRIAGLYTGTNLRTTWFRKRTIKYGRLSRNGDNFWVPDVYSATNTSVDWLPGCSMSFRVSSLKDMKFSEELMLGPTGGYSLGEDVDFSIRLSKLISLNSTSIQHVQAESVRDNNHVMSKARGRWKAYLVRKYPAQVSAMTCTISLIFSILYFGLRRFINKNQYLNPFNESKMQMASYIQELLNPTLVCKSSE